MIIRARLVVTMDGPPIENGAVLISGERIIEVGTLSDISKADSGKKVVDLGEQALLPGLINAHCHLDYTCLRGTIPRPKSFTDWIRTINAEKAKLSQDDYVNSMNDGFAESKRFGTTTIANLTGFPELVSRIEAPIRTWWFAELIDVREPSRANRIVDLAVDQLRTQKQWGLAPHAPFTASRDLYRRCEQMARRENILLATHLAESREEMSMFHDASGQLYDFLREIGRDMNDCGQGTPLAHFTRYIDLEDPWLITHLNELTKSDFDLLRRSRPNIHVVHCPRSHEYFGHSPFQFEKLRECGINVCLGTDSLASNGDLSLFGEMRAFQREFPTVSTEEILRMVTLNPALALGKRHVLGRIRRNHWADLIAVPIRRQASVFEEIIAFDQPVSWSMVDGRICA